MLHALLMTDRWLGYGRFMSRGTFVLCCVPTAGFSAATKVLGVLTAA